MPPVAGAVFAGLGAIGSFVTFDLAAGAVASLVGGIVAGAAVGGITAAVTGGDIGKGLLYGAVGGLAVAGGAGIISGELTMTSLMTSFADTFNPAEIPTGVSAPGGTSAYYGPGGAPTTTSFAEKFLGSKAFEGVGTALVSGLGSAASALMGDTPQDYTLEKIKSQEKMAAESNKAALEQAGMQMEASMASTEASRMSNKEATESRERIATGDREALIKKAQMEIDAARNLRQMDIDEVTAARKRAIAGAIGVKAPTRKGFQSTQTLSDIRNNIVNATPEQPNAATIVPVTYTQEQPA